MAETLKEIALNVKIMKLEEMLAERQRVLDEIPECKMHGKGCVAHAIQWVKKMKAVEDAIDNRHWEKR